MPLALYLYLAGATGPSAYLLWTGSEHECWDAAHVFAQAEDQPALAGVRRASCVWLARRP